MDGIVIALIDLNLHPIGSCLLCASSMFSIRCERTRRIFLAGYIDNII